MVDNQHKQISGYRDLSAGEIQAINGIKGFEAELGNLWKQVVAEHGGNVDMRWMSIAKTHFEEGFSAFVRAVARPVERF